MFDIIVAISKNWVIGKGNEIPWKSKEDMRFFRKTTTGSIIIMGYKTFQSIGRPLPNRLNIVINREISGDNYFEEREGVFHVASLKGAFNCICHISPGKRVFVIGGGKIYREALIHPELNRVYLTKINVKVEGGDITFPRLKDNFQLVSVIKGSSEDLEFRVYKRTDNKHEEYQYLEKIDEIMREGTVCKDRTGVGTKSLWGAQMVYDINQNFPLLTTKRTFLRMIIEELLWFLRGSTNNKELKDKNVHIWDGNMTREFMDKIGLTDREEDDGGPIYGFNFRHFGAKYKDCHTDYTGQGYDQVQEVLRLIREEPDSRRIIINLWNPTVLKDMVLPPCFVENTKVLTEYGYKNIQDVNENEKIYSHLNNLRNINKKYITNYSGIIHDIKIQYIPKFSCTPNHPFYVREVIYNKHLKLKQIECNEPKWINASELNNNHYHGIKINDKNIIPLFNIEKNINGTKKINLEKTLDNKLEWFFMGYYLGNGWSRWDRKGTFYICLNKKNSKELMEKFSKVCTTNSIKQQTEKCITYEFHSYILSNILKKFGRKANKKIIPNWVLNSPKEYLEEFINGYVCADGCEIMHNGNLSTIITTTSPDIAYKIQLILLKLNIISKVNYQKRKEKCVIEGRIVNQNDTYSINYFKNRKRQIRSFIKDGYAWFQLKNNETREVENINVYNFDVEEDHTYIVNNVSTHNCHFAYQFRVYGDKLSCAMVQRSGDMGLGVPFNIASATLMTYIFAKLTGKKPDKLVHTIHDTHVYLNHEEALKKQVGRVPYPFPIMNLKDTGQKSVEDFKLEDFEILGYESYSVLKMKMAV